LGNADLHMHTNASDGTGTPAENVRLARDAGLAAIAVTDHDTTAGLAEAMEAGRHYGVEVVPGVEISTALDGRDIHVLGYYIDFRNPAFQRRLESLRELRRRRNEEILARLAELGMPVDPEEAGLYRPDGRKDGTAGRGNIAAAMVRRGYVSDMREAFRRFLGEGKPAFVRVPRVSPEEAIAWIHEAGGTAIVAHPGLYKRDDLVIRLLEAGADGLEAYHPDHGAEDEERYRGMALEAGKIVTGGSDYHGERGGRVYHGPVGSRTVDTAVLSELRRNSRCRLG